MTNALVDDVPRAAIEAIREMREHVAANGLGAAYATDDAGVRHCAMRYGRNLLELLRESGVDHVNVGVSNGCGVPAISVMGMVGTRVVFSEIVVGDDIERV